MNKNSKILIVEDDINLGTSLKKFFTTENFQVQWTSTIESAKNELKNEQYDLMILDWMLPDGQGIDLVKDMQQQGKISLPIIMLTARTELIDKVLGLESGAHDYVTKPFEPRELLARVRVQLRSKKQEGVGNNANQNQKTSEVLVGDIRIALNEREVFFQEQLTEMTKMEYELLKLLAENPNRVFSREEILNKVWGYENYPTTRTVDTHVLQIRQKTRDDLIETVRGIGYRLKI